MVELSTLLIICLIVSILSVIGTVGFFLLLSTYLSVKSKKTEESEEPSGQYIIPLSGLSQMAGQPITQADIDRARDAILRYRGGGGEKKEAYVPNEGSYI